MAKFGSASAALTKAETIVNTQLANIDENEELDRYLQLIERLAKIQLAKA